MGRKHKRAEARQGPARERGDQGPFGRPHTAMRPGRRRPAGVGLGGGLEYLADDPMEAEFGGSGRSTRRRSVAGPGWESWDHTRRPAQEDAFERALRRQGVTDFRRNAPVGEFEVDFLFERRRVAVEIDGIFHLSRDAQEQDDRKERFLRQLGFRVIRFTNAEVKRSPEGCVRRLKAEFGRAWDASAGPGDEPTKG